MSVALTNLDRVLWPDAGWTKGDMIAYYRRAAPALLPHLAGRPLTMRRFPEGVVGPSWYQNQCRGGPAWLTRRDVADTTGKIWAFCVVEDERALLWVANQGTIELHPLADPREAVFDLDPGPGADVLDCCRVALRLRELLGDDARAKVSGSVGLHVHVPLDAGDARELARELAARLAAEDPQRVTDRRPLPHRRGRVLVDWLANDPLNSLVAPYSLRAMPWPTVAAPVSWAEVEEALAADRPELLTFLPDAVLERTESGLPGEWQEARAAQADLVAALLDDRLAAAPATPGRPEDERQEDPERAHGEQDPADRGHADGEGEDCADGDQKQADTDAHVLPP